MRSYEALASLQNWPDEYKKTMLRFYLADEAVTRSDNQLSQGLGAGPWYEIRQRFERYFSQGLVITPKAVLTREWDPKASSFYEHYKEMLRLFEISGLQDSWRTKVSKTSLPPYYARMCSGFERSDADEWYQRAAAIISSLPKYEAKSATRSAVKAIAAVEDVETLSRRSPTDKHDVTNDPSKCLFCCQINPNHKLEDCFCHPRKLRAAVARRNINVLEEAHEEETADILTEEESEDDEEIDELNVLTAVPSSMSLLTSSDSIDAITEVSNRAKMLINNIITVEGLIDSGA